MWRGLPREQLHFTNQVYVVIPAPQLVELLLSFVVAIYFNNLVNRHRQPAEPCLSANFVQRRSNFLNGSKPDQVIVLEDNKSSILSGASRLDGSGALANLMDSVC